MENLQLPSWSAPPVGAVFGALLFWATSKVNVLMDPEVADFHELLEDVRPWLQEANQPVVSPELFALVTGASCGFVAGVLLAVAGWCRSRRGLGR